MAYDSLYARLVANSVETDAGCWEWTGRVNRDNGYPVFTERMPDKPHPVKRYAHRAMLEETTGYLFPFDQAGHYRCYNTACINPDHLRIETSAENLSTRRGYAPCQGRWIPVLFPTPARELGDQIEAFLDTIF